MKKLLLNFLFIFSLILVVSPAQAQAQNFYSIDDIRLHQTPEDCWMTIDGAVYDLSNYLPNHERWLDIRGWCGRDATQDYNSKAGLNQEHSPRANELLADYLIGSLQTDNDIDPGTNDFNQSEENLNVSTKPNPVPGNRYNIYLPFFLTITLYLLSQKLFRKSTHDFFWNGILVLGLIPSVIFGFILAAADQFPILNKINLSGLLYQHVQLSIIFGTACILHFLKRLKIYLSQVKFVFKKRTL